MTVASEAQRSEVEDHAGAGKQEEWTATPATASEIRAQRRLSGTIEAVLDHVDDERPRSPRFQCGEENDQGGGRRSPVVDQPVQRPTDAGLQAAVGRHFLQRVLVRTGQPIQAEKGAAGQRVGDHAGEACLATEQRSHDEVKGPNFRQFEPFTAPRPGEVEGEGSRSDAGRGPHAAHLEFDPHPPDLCEPVERLVNLVLQRRLLLGQGDGEASGAASQYPTDLGKAKAEAAKGGNLGNLLQLPLAIDAPAGGRPRRGDQSPFLV